MKAKTKNGITTIAGLSVSGLAELLRTGRQIIRINQAGTADLSRPKNRQAVSISALEGATE